MDERTLHRLSYGLYIICSKRDEKINGQIANVVFQVTAEPQVIAISINKENLTHDFITESQVFSVSVLDQQTPMTLTGIFGFKSGRNIDKFQNIKYKLGKTGVPIILMNTIAFMEARVINTIDAGTHTIFVGQVEEAEILTEEKPMTYEYYHQVKGGVSPKTAPTYSDMIDNKKEDVKKMDKYVCTVCGYVYDPEKGDPDGGIAPGTKFEDIPDDWVCPVCGVSKEDFEKEE